MANRKTPKNSSKKPLEQLDQAQQEQVPDQGQSTLTHNPDGTVTVALPPDTPQSQSGLGSYDLEKGWYANLVEELDEITRNQLGADVLSTVDADEASRSDWIKSIELAFDLMGVKIEERNIPFEGACSAQHPLLMESAVKFQSKASNELLPPNGPVKTKVVGDITSDKEKQAYRVKAHMNYQITEEMTEFYPDTERLLLYTSLVGSGFKKTYYNSYLERPCSEFITADTFLVPNGAPDLHRADRYTQFLYKKEYELEADFCSGFYHKPEGGLSAPTTPKMNPVAKKANDLMGVQIPLGNRDKVYTLYEQHVMLHIQDLDPFEDEEKNEYKLASPYILTVDSQTGKVIGLRRNWKKDDPKRQKRVIYTHYVFVPSFNFYGYGFLHLLGNLQLTLTAAMRSLVDSGQFATLQGGFKLKGVRIVDDGAPIMPGQFKEVEAITQDITKSIMNLPFKEPSRVLFEMLNFIDGKGQKFADSTEHVLSEATNYGPVGTTMALLEASTKFFSAIHKRLHKSLKDELRLIAEINAETLPDNLDYNVENESMTISRADYGPAVAVIPVSDPNISSSAQRMAKAQALLQMAMGNPALHDMREIYKHVYANMEYANIDKLLPEPQQAQPLDPISDIQSAGRGLPIKAFPGQDHRSHIAIKQAFMQDPMSGQNPMMQKVSIQLQANIQEHMMLQFIESVQAMSQQAAQSGTSANGQQLGQNLQQSMATPQTQQGQMPQPMQNAQQQQQAAQNNPQAKQQQQMWQQIAMAAQKVAQMNLQTLQQQQAQQQQQGPQDPKAQAGLMIAHAEVQDTQTKAKKQQADENFHQGKLQIEKAKLLLDAKKEENRAREAGSQGQQDLDKIIMTKGLDAMINGLSNLHPASPTPGTQYDPLKPQLEQSRLQMQQLRMQNIQAKINKSQSDDSSQ